MEIMEIHIWSEGEWSGDGDACTIVANPSPIFDTEWVDEYDPQASMGELERFRQKLANIFSDLWDNGNVNVLYDFELEDYDGAC